MASARRPVGKITRPVSGSLWSLPARTHSTRHVCRAGPAACSPPRRPNLSMSCIRSPAPALVDQIGSTSPCFGIDIVKVCLLRLLCQCFDPVGVFAGFIMKSLSLRIDSNGIFNEQGGGAQHHGRWERQRCARGYRFHADAGAGNCLDNRRHKGRRPFPIISATRFAF